MFRKLAICLVLLSLLASAQAETPCLPRIPAEGGQLLRENYLFSEDYTCNVWVYAQSSQTDAAIRSQWLADCIDADFTAYATQVEDYPAYALEKDCKRAFWLPYYEGVSMLMVEQGMDYEEGQASPTATPDTPTATPDILPTPHKSFHYEYVSVERDCPSCLAGYCPICNGSGYTGFYSQRVPCPKECPSCGGKGTYTTYEERIVWDD